MQQIYGVQFAQFSQMCSDLQKHHPTNLIMTKQIYAVEARRIIENFWRLCEYDQISGWYGATSCRATTKTRSSR